MPVYALDGIVPALPPQGRYFVAPGARVIGNVTLHDEASVWFGAVLRGDNDKITVGARSNIQDNAMVHVDPGFPVSIGEGCTIGHHAILQGCNIGDRSLVGANALVTEGKVFEPGWLIVGAPARAVRKLDAAAIAQLRLPAAGYVANWRRFAAGLKEIAG